MPTIIYRRFVTVFRPLFIVLVGIPLLVLLFTGIASSQTDCASRQTKTECWGVVQVCKDGHFRIDGSWKTCKTYVCGACLGIKC